MNQIFNLDEQYIAFSLIDLQQFVQDLQRENVIDSEEYELIQDFINKVELKCGFNGGNYVEEKTTC